MQRKVYWQKKFTPESAFGPDEEKIMTRNIKAAHEYFFQIAIFYL